MERRWEAALQEQRRQEEEVAWLCRHPPEGLSEAERAPIRSLAYDLPALWQAAATTAADRQRVVRLLVEEVVVAVQGDSERVEVTIRWAGGESSRHELIRPVRRYEQLAGHQDLLKRIDELRREGLTVADVAARLNAEGFRPPKRSPTFNGSIVAGLLARGGRCGPRPRALDEGGLLGADEWLLSDWARELGMPQATLHRWIRVGWVHARKLPTPGGHWAVWAEADERERLARLRACPRGWSDEAVLAEMTKPKPREQNCPRIQSAAGRRQRSRRLAADTGISLWRHYGW